MANQETQKLQEILKTNKAESQVKENEEASLQDNEYSLDSDNLGSEDIHDVSDFEGLDESGEEDYLQ